MTEPTIVKVSTYIAHFLKIKEIHTIFELQGGMITRILDEISKTGGVKIVSMHHEQAAAFAADAFARITGKPGVALATSGPGATNLITGIGSCFFDSVPAIFITGQVNLTEQKGTLETRQIGFQETDIVEIVRPITKAAYAIKSADEIPVVFEEAYQLCMSGRPGPVLIDIPMNIQQELVSEPIFPVVSCDASINLLHDQQMNAFIHKFILALTGSKKPLILAGRGIRASKGTDAFLSFVERYNLPVVTSLLGLDVIPYTHPNRIGFIGTYGNRWANYALGNCDLLLVLGSRLDLRQTGANVDMFKANKQIFHVDIDHAELNNRFHDCETLQADVKNFLEVFLRENNEPIPFNGWVGEINEIKEKRPDTKELDNIKGINPNEIMHAISKKGAGIRAIVSDVGNNQMWAAQSLEIDKNQVYLTSGGMGAMGYALPASIGASISLNNSPVLMISGDGGFQINIQELQTIKRNNLPVKMLILNNQSLGMIRQFQDSYFDSCYQSTVWGYSAPDFELIAKAYGIKAATITSPDQVEEAIGTFMENMNEPMLLNVIIDTFTNAYPKTQYGMPITEMEPFVTPI